VSEAQQEPAPPTTKGIRQILATLPSGAPGVPLDDAELALYLRNHYNTDAEKERRERHRVRDDMYRDGGCGEMTRLVNEIFETEKVKEKRRKLVKYTRYSNPLKQIVGEMSTVYSEPAARSVGGDQGNEKRFKDVCDALMIDEVLDHANRMLNLHRAVLLGPRVRRDEDDVPSFVIDIVTPANAIAVVHPNDSTLVVAWIIRQEYKSFRTEWVRKPVWQLWSRQEAVILDESFHPVLNIPHELGMNPWLALTFSAEAIPGFWPGEEGEDLVAGRLMVWLSDLLGTKETKSATKMPMFSGDTSNMPREQALDTELPIQAPEGVSVTTTDMAMDTSMFRDQGDHVLGRNGQGYGLSLAALTHQGVQSADAREAMKEPLRQLRRRQIKTFRRGEPVLFTISSRVLAKNASDAPALQFQVLTYGVDFGEPQVLLSEAERLANFEKRRAMGLDNTVDMYIREVNPDADEREAWKAIQRNVTIETARVLLMRALQAISGSPRENMPGEGPATGPPPAVNDQVNPTSEAAPALASAVA